MGDLRLEDLLQVTGLNGEGPFRPAFSYSNDVWIGRSIVLRVSRPGNRWTSQHEQHVLSWLPEAVPHAGVVASGVFNGRRWLALHRLEGQVVGRAWAGLTTACRRDMIHQLGSAMQVMHGVAVPTSWQRPDLWLSSLAGLRTPVEVAEPFQQPPHRIRALASAARELQGTDVGLVDACVEFVSERLPLFALEDRRLVHSDLHWENLLTDGISLTGILDFEQAQPASPDLELDVLMRFCQWPFLPAAPDYEDQLHAADFQLVPRWLAVAYPELFSGPNLHPRLEAYAVMHDLRQGIQFPHQTGREYPPWWPWNRLRATLNGQSHLSALLP